MLSALTSSHECGSGPRTREEWDTALLRATTLESPVYTFRLT